MGTVLGWLQWIAFQSLTLLVVSSRPDRVTAESYQRPLGLYKWTKFSLAKLSACIGTHALSRRPIARLFDGLTDRMENRALSDAILKNRMESEGL